MSIAPTATPTLITGRSIDDSIHKIVKAISRDATVQHLLYDREKTSAEKLRGIYGYLDDKGFAVDPNKRYLVVRTINDALTPENQFVSFCPLLDVMQNVIDPKVYTRRCMGIDTICTGVFSDVIRNVHQCGFYSEMAEQEPQAVRLFRQMKGM